MIEFSLKSKYPPASTIAAGAGHYELNYVYYFQQSPRQPK